MKDKKESLLEKAAKVFTEPTKELNIPLDELQPFRNHPYKVRDDEEMELLTQSIRENGVLTPIIVTYMDVRKTKYDIISGHRRYLACKKLGFETIPAVFKELSYEEAVIAMVDSNLQREHILPSEKAKAYKMKMDANETTRQTNGFNFGPTWSEVGSGRYFNRGQSVTSKAVYTADKADTRVAR